MTPVDKPYPATPERPGGRFDATPEHQRVYLTVPFPENKQAKKHGAQWCWVERRWWICRNDLATHLGIHRWLDRGSTLTGKVREGHDFLQPKPRSGGVRLSPKASGRKPKGRKNHGPPVPTRRTDFSLLACQCLTPPWEHCKHTRAAQQSGGPESGASQLQSEAGWPDNKP